MAAGRPKGGKNTWELQQLYGQAKGWVTIGLPVAAACRKVGLSRNTYYWLEMRQKQLAAKKAESRAKKPDGSEAWRNKKAG